jgi:predicted glycoside hydrolase/deacetylase ChbG (UPF0249 family)
MVRRGAAEHAARLARRHTDLSVGLHIDLGEWELRDGAWRVRDWVVDPDDRAAVARELASQLQRFTRLMGREPSHLDSHQHTHRDEPARSVVAEMGTRMGVPVRGLSGDVVSRGDFFAMDGKGSPCPDAISVDRLVQIISEVPVGVTELACHPGDPTRLQSDYASERRTELETLCDPRVRGALREWGVSLRSHHTIRSGEEAAWIGK